VSLHARGGYRVETRHPVIASTLFPILFRSEVPFADEMDIHERLLWAAGRLSREHVKAGERNLLSILPRVYRQEGDLPRARQLFRIATKADPMQAPTWQAWAHMESEAGKIGGTDQPETARWLFQRATEVDPHDIPAWQAWAVMEGKAENVGDLEKPYTARWLFNKATEVDPRQAPIWQAWAHLEDRLGNRGDIKKPYTARWLFWKATEADPKHAPSWQAWAIMESDPTNMGDPGQKYSARWLFQQATEADPKDALSWQAWARMEAKARNMGGLEQKHTARWLFKQAIQVNSADAASWHSWAESERQFGSLERAREILREGLQHCPAASELLALQIQYRDLVDSPATERIRELLSSGDRAVFEAELKEALFKDPESPSLLELYRQWKQAGTA
jgi:crooked neck